MKISLALFFFSSLSLFHSLLLILIYLNLILSLYLSTFLSDSPKKSVYLIPILDKKKQQKQQQYNTIHACTHTWISEPQKKLEEKNMMND